MPTVLVADDNSNIQKMVSLALEERGITVVAVGNGEAAVRKLPELLPDVVLADVFMPVRNGYEVCEFVKADPRFERIPVILLIGAFDPLDEKEAHRVGANGVLKKPFVPPDPLIAMVTGFVAGMGKRQQAKPTPAEPSAEAATEAPDPGPDDYAVMRGPLSLRKEDQALEEAPLVEGAAEQSWDETADDSKRRVALSLEIPAELAPTSFGSEPEPANIPAQESPASPEPAAAAPEPVSVESASSIPAAGTSSNWMEMFAAEPHEFSAEPAEDFVVEATPEALAPSASISSEVPPEMLWQPAALAGQRSRSHTQTLTEPEPAPLPTEELTSAEIPWSPLPVAYDSGPYFPAPYLFDPGEALPHEVYPLSERPEVAVAPLPPEPKPAAEASAAAQVSTFLVPQAADSAMVDAVVAKVLERLEPQIRDILTREVVRPLAETLLQREIEKK